MILMIGLYNALAWTADTARHSKWQFNGMAARDRNPAEALSWQSAICDTDKQNGREETINISTRRDQAMNAAALAVTN